MSVRVHERPLAALPVGPQGAEAVDLPGSGHSAPRAARTFPGSRLLVLPGVGHVAQREAPEVVARAFGLLDDVAERRAAS